MKWIGALLFISITTWIGFERSNILQKRPKHIRQLLDALQILEAEMIYSQLPLQDVFKTIANQIPVPTRVFFNNVSLEMEKDASHFTYIWENHVVNFCKRAALNENEREILTQFGQTLGQHDLSQQKKHIQLTKTHLERELDIARTNEQKYGKMMKTLGFLCGLFIILLLI